MLNLQNEGVLQRLMDIFDTAVAATTTRGGVKTDVPDITDSGAPPATKFDFDVVSAILTAARLRDEQSRPPSRVVEALRSLPKVDVRKLQLRFHPDKLEKQLASRGATEEEKALSTAAFQLFNNIADADRKVPELVKEFEGEIMKYKAPLVKENPSSDATAEIAELLKEISTASPPKGKGRAM